MFDFAGQIFIDLLADVHSIGNDFFLLFFRLSFFLIPALLIIAAMGSLKRRLSSSQGRNF